MYIDIRTLFGKQTLNSVRGNCTHELNCQKCSQKTEAKTVIPDKIWIALSIHSFSNAYDLILFPTFVSVFCLAWEASLSFSCAMLMHRAQLRCVSQAACQDWWVFSTGLAYWHNRTDCLPVNMFVLLSSNVLALFRLYILLFVMRISHALETSQVMCNPV